MARTKTTIYHILTLPLRIERVDILTNSQSPKVEYAEQATMSSKLQTIVSGCKMHMVYISDYICKRMHRLYCFSKQKHTTATHHQFKLKKKLFAAAKLHSGIVSLQLLSMLPLPS